MLKLNETEKNSLLAQPETGMGYQSVDVILRNDEKQHGIAFNAELLFLGNESRTALLEKTYEVVLKSAQSSGNEIKALRVLPRERPISRSMWESGAVKKAAPAKDAPIEKTKADEAFKRFSAYANDNRRRLDGSWRDGTYATTEEDAKNVKTGKDAVARYALPNPAPASYVFTGRPHKDTDIQKGVVESAYGQPGGGVEVLFPKGTQPNTVTGPAKIADG